MLAAITALALFFSFLAAFYGYLAAPQQRLLPAPLPWRYAGDMAWRAALAALLLWVSRFGGYGVLVAIAAVLVGLGVLPLLALMRRFAWREWLLGGAARPAARHSRGGGRVFCVDGRHFLAGALRRRVFPAQCA